MSDDDKKVEFKIDANAEGFNRAMQQAQAAVKESSEKIQSSWSSLAGHFKAVNVALGAMVGVLAGGAFFKDAIGAANALNGETMGLAKSLGITGTEASALNTALGDIGSDSETYIDAFQKFAKQLKTNEEGLQAMGLKTRDANGHLRDSNTLFTEALQAVGEYKPGLDQTTAALTLFGKGVDEVMKLQKLSNAVIDEAREKNKELGFTVTNEGLEASKKYKAAMNDLGDVLLGVKNVIGQALMPVFTRLGEWLSGIGPTAVFTMKVAVDVLATALQTVVLAVKTVWTVFRALADPLFTFAGALKKLINGDMAGATADMLKVGDSWGAAMSGIWDRIKEDATRSWREVSNLWGQGTEVATPGKGKKTMGDFGKTNGAQKDTSRIAAWEAELQERTLNLQEQAQVEGRFAEISKEDERAYWRDKLALTQAGSVEQVSVRKKLATVGLELLKEEFATQQAAMHTQQEAQKNNLQKRGQLLGEEAALVAQMYGKHSKEYEAVQTRIAALARESAAQRLQLEEITQHRLRNIALAAVDADKAESDLRHQLALTSQEEYLEEERAFEERRHLIGLQALQQRLELLQADPGSNLIAIAQLNAEKELLEQQHQQRINKIRGELRVTQMQPLVDTYKAAEQALAQSINGILNRSMSMAQAMRSLWGGLSSAISNEISKQLAQEAVAWAVRRARALAGVEVNAVEAGSGAAASQASIPYIGPILAIAAMAAMLSQVRASKSSVPSAAMGYDIPAGLNPLTQLHEREMVLPAKHADVIRNLGDGNGSAAAQPMQVHLHVKAMDGASVKRVLIDNHEAVAAALATAVRNNSLTRGVLT